MRHGPTRSWIPRRPLPDQALTPVAPRGRSTDRPCAHGSKQCHQKAGSLSVHAEDQVLRAASVGKKRVWEQLCGPESDELLFEIVAV